MAAVSDRPAPRRRTGSSLRDCRGVNECCDPWLALVQPCNSRQRGGGGGGAGLPIPERHAEASGGNYFSVIIWPTVLFQPPYKLDICFCFSLVSTLIYLNKLALLFI